MLTQMRGRDLFRFQPSKAWLPRVNLYETESCFFVCAELPGMQREEIEVHVSDGVLRIRGVRKKPHLPQCPVGDPEGCSISVHLMEIDFGEFERKITLPADVAVEQISATYRNGYLWVVLPQAEAARLS